MNYYLFSLIIGLISTLIYYCIQNYQKKYVTRDSYIKFLIWSSLLSLVSIYGFLYVNNMLFFNLKNNIPILTGKPNF